MKDSQFIIIDEFTTPDIKTTTLNSMCDGTYQYPAKGGPSVKPTDHPIVIACGNKHPEEMYSNTYKYIEARFNVICVDTLPWDITGDKWRPIDNTNK